MIEATDIGQQEREKRRIGAKLKKNAGELTIVDFMSSDDGLPKYLRPGDPVAIPHADISILPPSREAGT